jgi:hypothetical protein
MKVSEGWVEVSRHAGAPRYTHQRQAAHRVRNGDSSAQEMQVHL